MTWVSGIPLSGSGFGSLLNQISMSRAPIFQFNCLMTPGMSVMSTTHSLSRHGENLATGRNE